MITGLDVRSYFQELTFNRNDPSVPIDRYYTLPDGIKGAINGILAKTTGGDANRKLVLKYLTGVASSTKLTPGQWYALYVLVRPYKDAALGWVADNPKFSRALDAILAELPKQEGQTLMEFEG